MEKPGLPACKRELPAPWNHVVTSGRVGGKRPSCRARPELRQGAIRLLANSEMLLYIHWSRPTGLMRLVAAAGPGSRLSADQLLQLSLGPYGARPIDRGQGRQNLRCGGVPYSALAEY